jgi:hypothetical protein
MANSTHSFSTQKPVPTNDTTARSELPVQAPGEVERREQEHSQLKNLTPVIPPHTAATVAPSAYLDREEIARLAYSYWLKRQGSGAAGTPEDDWIRAEQELREQGFDRGNSW